MNPEAYGTLGAALLMVGGLALVYFGWRSTRTVGVRRLRAVLEDGVGDDQPPSLARAWSSMVRATEDVSSGTGLHTGVGDRLRRAGWVLRPAEFLLLLAGAGGLAAVAGWSLGGLVPALMFAFVVPTVIFLVMSNRADQYSRKVDEQLPNALGQLGASMRSGHSLLQAIEGVAEHAAPPIGAELRRVVNETRVGRSMEEALVALGERLGSNDVRWSVRAMLIQRRTGGKLADILDVLAEFMREREEVRREVRALTAEGRISAAILLALPFVVTGAILAVRPTYLVPLIVEPVGRVMILVAVAGMTVAYVLIRQIVKVEV